MYKLKSPNPRYNGVTEGVPFSEGIGKTESKDIRNVLVNDYKYEDITDYSVLVESAKEIGKSTAEASGNASQELSQDIEEQLKEEKEETEDRPKEDLEGMTVPQLKEKAKGLGLQNYSELTKPQLIELITNA